MMNAGCDMKTLLSWVIILPCILEFGGATTNQSGCRLSMIEKMRAYISATIGAIVSKVGTGCAGSIRTVEALSLFMKNPSQVSTKVSLCQVGRSPAWPRLAEKRREI